MEEKIQKFLDQMCDPNEKEAYFFADKLGKVADEEVKNKLIALVNGDKWEIAYLASRALSVSSFNEEGINAVLEAIHDKRNIRQQGAFAQILGDFDLSQRFVDVFKIYLFGNFKSSTLAKSYLDEVEFEITPRTIRKAEKHWNHYLHNPEDEDSALVKKNEVELMFQEMKELLSGE